jgi:mRNA interferase MazF
MALSFHPAQGAILLCDYSGFKPPEMVKRRPVIVISPRLRRRDNLCTVVPLSTTAPEAPQDYHCELELPRPLPAPWNAARHWIKADMLATVGFHRLNLIGIGRDQCGKRKYLNMTITQDSLKAVQYCVLRALGLQP